MRIGKGARPELYRFLRAMEPLTEDNSLHAEAVRKAKKKSGPNAHGRVSLLGYSNFIEERLQENIDPSDQGSVSKDYKCFQPSYRFAFERASNGRAAAALDSAHFPILLKWTCVYAVIYDAFCVLTNSENPNARCNVEQWMKNCRKMNAYDFRGFEDLADLRSNPMSLAAFFFVEIDRSEDQLVELEEWVDFIVDMETGARKKAIDSEPVEDASEQDVAEHQAATTELGKCLSEEPPDVIDPSVKLLTITRASLSELHRTSNPPPVTQYVLEAVCQLLGNRLEQDQASSTMLHQWSDIQKIMKDRSFNKQIINYDIEKSRLEIEDFIRIEKDYLRNISRQEAARASQALGQLCDWAKMVIEFAQKSKDRKYKNKKLPLVPQLNIRLSQDDIIFADAIEDPVRGRNKDREVTPPTTPPRDKGRTKSSRLGREMSLDRGSSSREKKRHV